MTKHLISTTNMIQLLSILALMALFAAAAAAQSPVAPAASLAAGPDLSPSAKQVDKRFAMNGERLRYTIVLANKGTADAAGVLLTDTLPLNTAFVPGSGWASKGDFLGTLGLMWTGPISVGEQVTVGFDVTITAGTLAWPIINVAHIDDGTGTVIARTATTTANPRRLFLPIIPKGYGGIDG